MGIRPQFYIMVGITNANPKDRKLVATYDDLDDESKLVYYQSDWDDDKRYHDQEIPGYEFSTLGEIIYNPFADPEYTIGNVVGMLLSHKTKAHNYDDDVLRALATVDEKFMHKGYLTIPGIRKDERRMLRDKITYEDIECNRVVPGVFESMIQISRLHWKRAVFYLAQVGWIVSEKDLYYILAWDWS